MSKKIIILCLGIMTIFQSFSQTGFTKVANEQAVYDKLKVVADKTSTIQSDFVEEKYLAAFNKPQITKGKFYYKHLLKRL